jgi:hypothetical protein
MFPKMLCIFPNIAVMFVKMTAVLCYPAAVLPNINVQFAKALR